MQSIEILDIKQFMQLLFQTDKLDSYEFVSSKIVTDMSYELDGHINRNFFSTEELTQNGLNECTYLPWQLARDKNFLLIKGKRTPSELKIVLKLSKEQMNQFLSNSNSSLNPNDIDGMFLNVLFHENKLNVICGISYKIFTLEKNLESDFSQSIITLFKSYCIACE